ncbi:MAG: GLPGLI family protein [Flavobacteriaceae bacterium]|nr:GLPGLI family protein [Bacteroidia bacterium]MBT8286376.1 GLPGLI family protein [Bacteroidia bacterium]NNF76084.1 GLPGLI family protein [Flavobacteriaceae bacterium]NNK71558.1 GLPGLI family protein [Flavobacteriaceae bacterium]
MMKSIKTLCLMIALLMSGIGIAQEFQGEAMYKSHRQMNIQFDSTQVNSDMHKRMMDMMKKQFEKTFKLTFNKEESLYKEEEQLESPQPAGMQMVMVDTGGSDILYKNTKDDNFTSQNEVFGKIFLIEDQLEKRDWTLSNETKNIGDYTCYKATYTREQPVVRSFISVNGDNDPEEDENAEPEMEEITVTAWYAPDIPVNNGPGRYQGLPGLILEVNDGPVSLLCSRIILNTKDQIKIEKPSKGKRVNQKEYDEIVDKKMREMNNRYDSDRRNGHNVEIRIGG